MMKQMNVEDLRSEIERLEMYPEIPHRIVETIRTTVALAAQGDELCR